MKARGEALPLGAIRRCGPSSAPSKGAFSPCVAVIFSPSSKKLVISESALARFLPQRHFERNLNLVWPFINRTSGGAQRGPFYKNFAPMPGQQTAFLCHSNLDRTLAEGLQTLLREGGWDLYIDWQDSDLPPVPNRLTAERIQERIVVTDWFLFLATSHSMASRWCPWEIGFADGKKPFERIVVIQTLDDQRHSHGNEYIDLYNRVDPVHLGGLQLVRTGQVFGRNLSTIR